MKKYDLTTQSMVRIAMFTAVLSVLSVLQIPMPSGVPLTLQTFAVALCGAVLGAWSGPASVALYVAVGAVGIPVFAGMKGGIAVLVGPTGGFLFGFLFLAWLTGAGVFQAFVTVSLPYLLKDALSVAAAVQIGEMLRKRLVFGHVFK